MNLIRKFKIYKLDPCLVGTELEIFELFKEKLTNLQEFKLKEMPISIYYMNKEGKCIYQRDYKHNGLYIAYEGFWEVLNDKYGLNYYEIGILVKYMMKTTASIISFMKYSMEDKAKYAYSKRSIE